MRKQYTPKERGKSRAEAVRMYRHAVKQGNSEQAKKLKERYNL